MTEPADQAQAQKRRRAFRGLTWILALVLCSYPLTYGMLRGQRVLFRTDGVYNIDPGMVARTPGGVGPGWGSARITATSPDRRWLESVYAPLVVVECFLRSSWGDY